MPREGIVSKVGGAANDVQQYSWLYLKEVDTCFWSNNDIHLSWKYMILFTDAGFRPK